MRVLVFLLAAFLLSPVVASEQIFKFANPSFSGDGFSSHALTIENMEYNRKQAIKQEHKAAQDALETAAKNTNLSKFLNNLESRIYAQLSLQMSNAMFSDGATSGTMNFEGTTISWIKDVTTNMIKLTLIDPTGNRTEISVPIGSFKF